MRSLAGVSRIQLAVYAAIGIVLLLLGLRAARAADQGDPGAERGALRFASEPVGTAGPGASEGDLVVHVAGAVADPGVYRLPAGSRVTDAVERAGGANGRAQPNAINLAARLADGQQVVVPERVSGADGTPSTAGTAIADDGPISLGTATEAELDTIEGIGPVTAGDILQYRDENGGVASIEQLDEISGIGPATIEALKDRLSP